MDRTVEVVTILSGGMDSTTLAYDIASLGRHQYFLSFDYGQRHKFELVMASRTAAALGCEHSIIDLPISKLLTGSSLTDSSVQVPHGHYEEESMKATVVPGRNAIMLSIAWAVAACKQAKVVACGVHAGDHAIYPDCRPEFLRSLTQSLFLGTGFDGPVDIFAPYIGITKVEILQRGVELSVPYEQTWTCYEGDGKQACGRCGSCCERLTAFATVSIEDPLLYKDRKYWIEAANKFGIEKE